MHAHAAKHTRLTPTPNGEVIFRASNTTAATFFHADCSGGLDNQRSTLTVSRPREYHSFLQFLLHDKGTGVSKAVAPKPHTRFGLPPLGAAIAQPTASRRQGLNLLGSDRSSERSIQGHPRPPPRQRRQKEPATRRLSMPYMNHSKACRTI
jgi:hypothetical protein